MNDALFIAQREQACTEWLRLEKYRLAYSRAHDGNHKKATKIDLATIILGTLAGASGLFALIGEQLLGADGDFFPALVMAIVGLGTAVAAGMRQHKNWGERAAEYWKAHSEIEYLESELQAYIGLVSAVGSRAYDAAYFQKKSTAFRDAGLLRVENLDSFLEEAEQKLDAQSFRTLELQAQEEGEVDAEPLAEETVSAGIEPLQRGEV